MKQTITDQPARPILLTSIGVLVLSILVLIAANVFRSSPEKRSPKPLVPLVSTLVAPKPSHMIEIQSQGVVRPQHQTELFSEVSGRVVDISPSFEAGAFVKAGERLLKIEDTDYIANLKAAEAEYARAAAAYEQALEETRQAEKDWEILGRKGQANDLALKKPQLAQARAAVKSAKVGLTRAQKEQERTEIRAPYDGLIAERPVQFGQFVSAGSVLGTIYGTDAAEVRLPVTFEESMLLKGQGHSVALESEAMPGIQWPATLHRVDNRIREDNRMVYLTVRVASPYADTQKSQLPFGLYVTGTIAAQTSAPIYKVPRTALRAKGKLWVVNTGSELELRTPDVLYKDKTQVYLQSGLEKGEQLLLSGVGTPLPGMKVRVSGDVNNRGLTDNHAAPQSIDPNNN